eukprot:gene882-985_t
MVPKAIPVQKSTAKSTISVENVTVHEEEEAERRLLNDKRQSEDDTFLDDGSASMSGEEVPAPLSTGANKRSIFVTDPEELEILERLREKKLRTLSSSGADTPISLREDGAYSDITTSSSLQDRDLYPTISGLVTEKLYSVMMSCLDLKTYLFKLPGNNKDNIISKFMNIDSKNERLLSFIPSESTKAAFKEQIDEERTYFYEKELSGIAESGRSKN